MPASASCPRPSRDRNGDGSGRGFPLSRAGPAGRPAPRATGLPGTFPPRPEPLPSLRPDRGRHPRHRGHRDDDLRGRLPQPLRHRHRPGGGLRVHVSPLQGRPGRGPGPAGPAAGGAGVPSGRLADSPPATRAAVLGFACRAFPQWPTSAAFGATGCAVGRPSGRWPRCVARTGEGSASSQSRPEVGREDASVRRGLSFRSSAARLSRRPARGVNPRAWPVAPRGRLHGGTATLSRGLKRF